MRTMRKIIFALIFTSMIGGAPASLVNAQKLAPKPQATFPNDPECDQQLLAQLNLTPELLLDLAQRTPKVQRVVGMVIGSKVDWADPDMVDRGLPGSDRIFTDDGSFDPSDNHETHITSAVTAKNNNAWRICSPAGFSDRVKIISVTVLNSQGRWSMKEVRDALQYALTIPDLVAINFSGGGGDSLPEETKPLIAQLNQRGVQWFISAGRTGPVGRDLDTEGDFLSPQNYVTLFPNVILTAGIDREGQRQQTSNYGKKRVALGAPASNIITVKGAASGPSMGSPFSFILYMLVRLYAETDPVSARERILYTAYLPEHLESDLRYGVVNMSAALAENFGCPQPSGPILATDGAWVLTSGPPITPRARALDSVTQTRAPFPPKSQYVGPAWTPTSIALFGYNVGLGAGESPSAVTIVLKDAVGKEFLPIPADAVVKPAVGTNTPHECLWQVNFRLPEGVAAGNAEVTLKKGGAVSSKGLLVIAAPQN